MSYFHDAVAVFSHAEGKLRDVVQRAAASGDYHAVVKLAALAQELDELRRSIDTEALPSRNAPAERAGVHRKAGKGASTSRPTYPLFARQNDALVKVGWSKTGQTEYEHRAPRTVVDLVTASIAEKSRRNRKFTTDDIFPLINRDGNDVPLYQSYVCLAWLCAAGALERLGRQGYVVVSKGPLEQTVEGLWEQLAER